eukprot:gnl/MRDRNA2_/MRDRNA2_97962_c0_seq1.p1 gnl/MRDRNA2_/MRDRNA2_97962_c0~~gnl/MRDRNA2_/MRDRNA2_97962_c0_seq1.p1  ORF type:complete len:187 (-),score=18.51 gnl/MRDRNA2_/MRDRNA2_97962_c0_seq1:53-613(-)
MPAPENRTHTIGRDLSAAGDYVHSYERPKIAWVGPLYPASRSSAMNILKRIPSPSSNTFGLDGLRKTFHAGSSSSSAEQTKRVNLRDGADALSEMMFGPTTYQAQCRPGTRQRIISERARSLADLQLYRRGVGADKGSDLPSGRPLGWQSNFREYISSSVPSHPAAEHTLRERENRPRYRPLMRLG